jgi:hydrogenase nickel incorporation protein HypA/HybF
MHELGIAEGILASAVRGAEDAGASRINRVDVTIGVLTEVMEDALQFAWEAIRTDTMAENAALTVTMLDARTRCSDCGHEWVHDRYTGAQCPACSSYIVMLLAGRELKIDAIDID